MMSSSQMWKVTLLAVFLLPSCLGKLRTAAHHCLNYHISHARSPVPMLIRRHQSGSLYQLASHVRRYRGGVSERDVGYRVRRQSQHPLEREERPGVLSRPGLQRSTQFRGSEHVRRGEGPPATTIFISVQFYYARGGGKGPIYIF